MSNRKTLVVIAGPTGVGKTPLAVSLARVWDTEIVSADSRQVFREMTIGTAKPSAEELALVPHHFINTKSIRESYDAGQYGRDALACIQSLFINNDCVILCGGSGLYINAVCDGFDDLPAVSPRTREKIVADFHEKGLSWLQQEVASKDPEYFTLVDRQNPHRLMRALELFHTTGQPMAQLRKRKAAVREFSICKIGLNIGRELLYQRIDRRVDAMVAAGLEEEARRLLPFRDLNALQTVGYAEWFGYFDGRYDREEAIRLLKRNTRHYAKRQLTWFTRDDQMQWFEPDQVSGIINACEKIMINSEASHES